MIEIKKGYDSEVSVEICDWCQGQIGPADNKILYGTGDCLVVIYHPKCDRTRRQVYGSIPLAR